jgi:beta-lactamase superfamily II metal-dependent hydrolase
MFTHSMRLAVAVAGLMALRSEVALAATRPAGVEAVVGEVLPSTPPGGLDIHHINTGEGNAALLVLPDQTTVLIDCGSNRGVARLPGFKAPPRPDGSRLPGEWVARYVRQVHPRGADAPVDYGVASHFHADHIAGFPEFLRHVRIATFLDRGWPDYGDPLPFTGGGAALYKAALAGQVKSHGMKVERFRGGVADQIVLRHEPRRYPDFEVRHLAVNGEAWTGEGTAMRRRVVAGAALQENALCAALRVRYGAFDYFAGGDLLGTAEKPEIPASRDVESAVAWVTGPVDVLMLNHHGNSDATSPFFVSVLQPRVCIAQVWDAQQVDPTVLARLRSPLLGPGPRDIFMTNGEWPERDAHVVRVFGEAAGRKHVEDLKAIAARQGHIVVRVAPGGASYHVVVLTDADESRHVRSVHGPYPSR